MSCGNRFQCALTKSSRHSFQPDKPSNPNLHNENQMRLNELLQARKCQDTIYSYTSLPTIPITTTIQQQTKSKMPSNDTDYTPWTTPSTQYYILNQK